MPKKDGPMEPVICLHSGAVTEVILNSPETGNALSDSMLESLASVLETFDKDPKVRAFVLSGLRNEACFAQGPSPTLCANAMKGRQHLIDSAAPNIAEIIHNDRFRIWDRIRRIEKPMVAAVQGSALGEGFELALLCDFIVVDQKARLEFPDTGLGFMPCAGATQHLTHLAGKMRAMELILLGRPISGKEAASWGIANLALPRSRVHAAAMKLASRLASQAPLAVRNAKQAILAALKTNLEEGFQQERNLFSLLFGTSDLREGFRSFMENRKPKFNGK